MVKETKSFVMIKAKSDEVKNEVLISHEFPELVPEDEQTLADMVAYKPKMRGWTLLDLQTAHMMCTVYDALSEENRAKLSGLSWMRQIDVCWKLVSKN
jgi:hypothetical protein